MTLKRSVKGRAGGTSTGAGGGVRPDGRSHGIVTGTRCDGATHAVPVAACPFFAGEGRSQFAAWQCEQCLGLRLRYMPRQVWAQRMQCHVGRSTSATLPRMRAISSVRAARWRRRSRTWRIWSSDRSGERVVLKVIALSRYSHRGSVSMALEYHYCENYKNDEKVRAGTESCANASHVRVGDNSRTMTIVLRIIVRVLVRGRGGAGEHVCACTRVCAHDDGDA